MYLEIVGSAIILKSNIKGYKMCKYLRRYWRDSY